MTPPKTAEAPAPMLPRPKTKAEAQEILRLYSIHGLKIDSIDDGRIYGLTAPMLMPDNTMRRTAVTVVFTLDKEQGTVKAVKLDGWLVGDQIPWSSL